MREIQIKTALSLFILSQGSGVPHLRRRLERGLRGEQAEDDEVHGDGQIGRALQQLPGVRVRHAVEDASKVGKGH